MSNKKPKKEVQQKPEGYVFGRPTVYKPEYAQMFLEYFSSDITKKDGDRELAAEYKTKAGFALKIGVHKETLIEWAKKYPDFSEAYKKAELWQEQYLLNNGMKGLIQQPMAIFVAKNNIGYADKQEIKSEIKQQIEVSIVDVSERVKRLKGEE